MMQLCFTIPDEAVSRLIDAFAERYPLDAIEGETRAQYARRMLGRHIKSYVVDYEARIAEGNTRSKADAEITVTVQAPT